MLPMMQPGTAPAAHVLDHTLPPLATLTAARGAMALALG
jgi:hypothetical protein